MLKDAKWMIDETLVLNTLQFHYVDTFSVSNFDQCNHNSRISSTTLMKSRNVLHNVCTFLEQQGMGTTRSETHKQWKFQLLRCSLNISPDSSYRTWTRAHAARYDTVARCPRSLKKRENKKKERNISTSPTCRVDSRFSRNYVSRRIERLGHRIAMWRPVD